MRGQAGLKANYEKTCIYRIGSLRHSNARLYTIEQFTWTNEPVLVLGIDISHDRTELLTINYEKIVKKVDSLTNIWSTRDLSIESKVITVNTLMSSQFIYKISNLNSLPDEYVKHYEKSVNIFIWGENDQH